MTNESLRSYVLLRFDKLMKASNYKLFKAEIDEILDNKDQDSNELAKHLNQSPEFEIMQKYFVRTTLKSIESQLKTIKVIIVICFICAILVGLFGSGI